ncbi:MAG: AtpZ/AtpI family protein [Selenomonadaceae bacterium]|nr:AtpZ/AtpI family protein [Selenomonadaceae bacterium]
MSNNDKNNSFQRIWRAFSLLSGVGIYIVVVILICLYIGGLVDDYFSLNGKAKLIGIILGFPIAFYSLYRQLKNGGII